MRNEEIGRDNGEAWIEPGGPFIAGTRRVLKIVYRAGLRGIDTGGSVRFEFPYPFPFPQWESMSDEGFIQVRCSREDVKLRLSYEIPVPKKDEGFFYVTRWGRMVYVQVVEGRLQEGDIVEVTYGRPFHCTVPGVLIPYFAQILEFTVATDVDGTRSAKFSGYTLCRRQPVVEIIGGPPAKLVAFADSLARPSDSVRVRIVARDVLGNTALSQPRELEISGPGPARVELPRGLTAVEPAMSERGQAEPLDARSNPYASGEAVDHEKLAQERTVPAVPREASLQAEGPGLWRVEVRSLDLGLQARANPTVVREDAELKIFWGDIHGHTRLSDGLGTPESYYAFARDEACLDFAAIADHSQYMGDEDWQWIIEATRRFNEPGRFVTLLGYEYSLNAPKPHYGDKCIYYPGDAGPLLRATDILRTEYADMAEHAQEWKRHGAMMIVHQHAMGTCSFYDPELVRLAEVYSVWGASESPEAARELLPARVRDYSGHWVADALAKGWILGFVAGSDDHAGRPGNTSWLRRSSAWPGGLAAVWAPELTREAIWQALWNRRCYATTGARIFLDFHVLGRPMGSVIEEPHEGPVPVRIQVAGTAPVERVQIVRDGQLVHEWRGRAEDVAIEFEDRPPEAGLHWWYARVFQADGEMAWPSPVWLKAGQE